MRVIDQWPKVLALAGVVVLLGMPNAASAQSGAASAPKSPMQQAIEGAAASQTPRSGAASGVEAPPTALPHSPSDVALSDPVTRQKYLEAMQRYYEYRANGYAYRSRVFEWQLMSSRVIFAAVLLLVLAGVYFAAVQFHVALRSMGGRRGQGSAEAASSAATAAESLKTELDVSAKGIAVKSSVLGVVVLALSLAFYYLYLVYVYPIQNVL